MYQSLTSLFYDGVRPTFEEYIVATARRVVGDGSLLRPARAAIDLLYSFGDHYKNNHDPKFTPIHIETQCSGYKLLANLADAGKHSIINRHNPEVTKATQMSEAVRYTTFRDVSGLYINSEALTVVTLDDGTEVDILFTLSKVINFWGKQLHDDNLMSFRYIHTYMGERVIPRHLVLPSVEMNFTVGIPVSVKILPRAYNYSKNEFYDVPFESN